MNHPKHSRAPGVEPPKTQPAPGVEPPRHHRKRKQAYDVWSLVWRGVCFFVCVGGCTMCVCCVCVGVHYVCMLCVCVVHDVHVCVVCVGGCTMCVCGWVGGGGEVYYV